MLTAFHVITRIVANPVSNVFQKQLVHRGANPLFIIAATHAVLTVALAPLLVSTRWTELAAGFWGNIAVCTVLAVIGNALLVAALGRGDLSVLGPINAYKSVLSLGLAVFLLKELPTALGLIGVGLVVAGSLVVVDREPTARGRRRTFSFLHDRGIQLRLAALVFSSTEAVFLKRAILQASPLTTFLSWSALGLPVAAAMLAFLPSGTTREEARVFARNWGRYLWLALATGLMQAATLFTFGQLQVGYSLALFQLSTLISVFLGYRYFAEKNIRRRLVGSLIMVSGAVLIVVFGRQG